jgi:putative transposase
MSREKAVVAAAVPAAGPSPCRRQRPGRAPLQLRLYSGAATTYTRAMNKPGRPPRLPTVFQKYDAPVYFVTICAAQRKTLFAHDVVHAAFRDFAECGQREHRTAVGRYVLMPDHIHLFVCGESDFDLGLWVCGLKRIVGKAVPAAVPGPATAVPGGAAAVPAAESGKAPETSAIWQRGFSDHLLRNAESYAQKWEYVRQNPVRAGLVARPEDWPYQGEIVAIDRV